MYVAKESKEFLSRDLPRGFRHRYVVRAYVWRGGPRVLETCVSYDVVRAKWKTVVMSQNLKVLYFWEDDDVMKARLRGQMFFKKEIK